MVTTEELLLPIFEKFPNIKLREAQKEIPSLTKPNFYKVRRQFLGAKDKPKSIPGKQSIKNKTKSIPPQNTPLSFIDDPDELLLSVSMRELNKPDPDPRWANTLIAVRKEKIGLSKKEGNIQSKFKSMNIKDIVQIISSQKEKNTLQKPGLKEHS